MAMAPVDQSNSVKVSVIGNYCVYYDVGHHKKIMAVLFVAANQLDYLLHVIPVGDDTTLNGPFEVQNSPVFPCILTDFHAADYGMQRTLRLSLSSQTELAESRAVINDHSSSIWTRHGSRSLSIKVKSTGLRAAALDVLSYSVPPHLMVHSSSTAILTLLCDVMT